MADTQTQNTQTQQPHQAGEMSQANQSQPSTGQNQAGSGQSAGSSGQNQALTRPYSSAPLQRHESFMSDPFTTMQRLSDEMDSIFERFGFGRHPLRGWRGSSAGPMSREMTSVWSPQIEIEERDNNLVICADLPGLNKDEVKIQVEDNMLTITGERKNQREETREGFYHSERSYGSFQRSIPLPDGVNPDEIKANFRDGVLEVTMPAPPRRQPNGRRIEIQGS